VNLFHDRRSISLKKSFDMIWIRGCWNFFFLMFEITMGKNITFQAYKRSATLLSWQERRAAAGSCFSNRRKQEEHLWLTTDSWQLTLPLFIGYSFLFLVFAALEDQSSLRFFTKKIFFREHLTSSFAFLHPFSKQRFPAKTLVAPSAKTAINTYW